MTKELQEAIRNSKSWQWQPCERANILQTDLKQLLSAVERLEKERDDALANNLRLREVLEYVQKIANGEEQVAINDTDALVIIEQQIDKALSTKPSLEVIRKDDEVLCDMIGLFKLIHNQLLSKLSCDSRSADETKDDKEFIYKILQQATAKQIGVRKG